MGVTTGKVTTEVARPVLAQFYATIEMATRYADAEAARRERVRRGRGSDEGPAAWQERGRGDRGIGQRWPKSLALGRRHPGWKSREDDAAVKSSGGYPRSPPGCPGGPSAAPTRAVRHPLWQQAWDPRFSPAGARCPTSSSSSCQVSPRSMALFEWNGFAQGTSSWGWTISSGSPGPGHRDRDRQRGRISPWAICRFRSGLSSATS